MQARSLGGLLQLVTHGTGKCFHSLGHWLASFAHRIDRMTCTMDARVFVRSFVSLFKTGARHTQHQVVREIASIGKVEFQNHESKHL